MRCVLHGLLCFPRCAGELHKIAIGAAQPLRTMLAESSAVDRLLTVEALYEIAYAAIGTCIRCQRRQRAF